MSHLPKNYCENQMRYVKMLWKPSSYKQILKKKSVKNQKPNNRCRKQSYLNFPYLTKAELYENHLSQRQISFGTVAFGIVLWNSPKHCVNSPHQNLPLFEALSPPPLIKLVGKSLSLDVSVEHNTFLSYSSVYCQLICKPLTIQT